MQKVSKYFALVHSHYSITREEAAAGGKEGTGKKICLNKRTGKLAKKLFLQFESNCGFGFWLLLKIHLCIISV